VTRTRLPDRRASVTKRVAHATAAGKSINLLVTVGFGDSGLPSEVFCADFKAGSDLHAAVTDACILLSRLLQHGDAPGELVASMCSPPSLIGTIARAVAEEETDDDD
jgi:hypothetical protein